MPEALRRLVDNAASSTELAIGKRSARVVCPAALLLLPLLMHITRSPKPTVTDGLPLCGRCFPGTRGPCQSPKDLLCYDFMPPVSKQPPPLPPAFHAVP